MTIEQQNEKAIRDCMDLFNQKTMEWVDIHYSKSLQWVELPTVSYPQGRQGGWEALRQSASQSLTLFPDQQMTILNLVAQGDQVVLDQDWIGTLAIDVGGMKAGTPVHLRIASFFTLENGLIVGQMDYVKTIAS